MREAVEFESNFPCLMGVIASLDDNREIEQLTQQLNWVPDHLVATMISAFYKNEMVAVIDQANTELTDVLGERWDSLKA